jgi:hypothetical protein
MPQDVSFVSDDDDETSVITDDGEYHSLLTTEEQSASDSIWKPGEVSHDELCCWPNAERSNSGWMARMHYTCHLLQMWQYENNLPHMNTFGMK